MLNSNCCLEPVSYAAVEEDGTGGLVIEVFDDLDKVGADVVLLHGWHMANFYTDQHTVLLHTRYIVPS